MSSGPSLGGDRPQDVRKGPEMFSGWRHLQRSLGVSLPGSVKRTRKLVQANLRRKG